jgi:hypothetical protein
LVKPDIVTLKTSKRVLQVADQLISLPGLDHDVIHVHLHDLSNEVTQASLHASLIRGPCVLEPERHGEIEIHAKLRDEGGGELFGLPHRDLVIA